MFKQRREDDCLDSVCPVVKDAVERTGHLRRAAVALIPHSRWMETDQREAHRERVTGDSASDKEALLRSHSGVTEGWLNNKRLTLVCRQCEHVIPSFVGVGTELGKFVDVYGQNHTFGIQVGRRGKPQRSQRVRRDIEQTSRSSVMLEVRQHIGFAKSSRSVSYTHLTLPT